MRLAALHDVIYGELWHWVSAPINGDPKRRIIVGSRLAEATGFRALRKHHQAARYFAGKRHAANNLIYHQHPGAPVIKTYYPRPGPYARQRMRLAAEADQQ
ncbi:hypothetical protein [Actinomadura sp. GTD37]|uniref:hypothetical protein n=1 Tax=Actinomadura sp. GTD37 TaxID=1778030 RepID=UPI0035C212F6